eukprot:8074043-Pyramimonas_sp.AAC.1
MHEGRGMRPGGPPNRYPYTSCIPEQVAPDPLGGVSELGPDPAVDRIGVDLIRGLAFFGFSSRA